MIIPILGKNNEPLGTASVERVGKKARDFSVTFYLKSGHVMSEEVKKKAERSLITIARDAEKKKGWKR